MPQTLFQSARFSRIYFTNKVSKERVRATGDKYMNLYIYIYITYYYFMHVHVKFGEFSVLALRNLGDGRRLFDRVFASAPDFRFVKFFLRQLISKLLLLLLRAPGDRWAEAAAREAEAAARATECLLSTPGKI